jgi:hypothetical protein
VLKLVMVTTYKYKNPKSNKRWNHHRGDKKGKTKKGQKMNWPHGPKKRRKLIPLLVGNYFTYGPP